MKKVFLTMLLIIVSVAVLVNGCASPAPAPTETPTPAAPATTSPTADKTIDLKIIYHFTTGSVSKLMLNPWTDRISQETNGRVKITHYPGSSLVRQEDEYDAVESGMADMAVFVPAPGRFPQCEIISLPKLFPNAQVSARVYNEILEKHLVQTELKNVKLLWVVGFPLLQLLSNKPVHTISDFKGMKIWTTTKVEGWINDRLGTSGINLPVADLYTSLERGLIDGLFFAWDGSFFFEFYKVTNYRTQANMFTRAYPVVMNKNVWNNLPADVKKVFENNSGPNISAEYAAKLDASEISWRDKIAAFDKANGKEGPYFLPPEEDAKWQETLKPIWEQWVKEMEGKGLTSARTILNDTTDLIKRYSK